MDGKCKTIDAVKTANPRKSADRSGRSPLMSYLPSNDFNAALVLYIDTSRRSTRRFAVDETQPFPHGAGMQN